MSELWSYSLDDLLLFSPRVYFRMIELHNQALWPAQVLAVLLGLAAILFVVRPSAQRDRLISVIFAAAWLFIALSFFWQQYATINWAAVYFAPIAALEAALLLGLGTFKGWLHFKPPRTAWARVALGLMAFAIIGYPFMAVCLGRPWGTAEVFGIAPDPTAIATVAMLALANGRLRWVLMMIPILWCLTTGLTLWVMKDAGFWIAPVCALLGVALALKLQRQ